MSPEVWPIMLLNPQAAWTHWWGHYVYASGGSRLYEIVLYIDNSVEIALEYVGMGVPRYRYELFGQHTPLSEGYGWLSITRIQKRDPVDTSTPRELNLSEFECDIILEYFRIVRSPHDEHPQDMINMAARWPTHFDVLITVQDFVQANIEGYRFEVQEYADQPPSADYKAPNMPLIEEIATVMSMIDKSKFRRVDQPTQ